MSRGFPSDADLGYLREFEHITMARILIAQYQNDRMSSSIHPAMQFLDRLLKSVEEGRRMGSVIELLVLQALAHQAQDNLTSALEPLNVRFPWQSRRVMSASLWTKADRWRSCWREWKQWSDHSEQKRMSANCFRLSKWVPPAAPLQKKSVTT